MRKTLPETLFADPEQSRLSMLRNWALDHQVTEIEMNERQFWNFAQLQPLAEKPWRTFMGRHIYVPKMPEGAQKCLDIFDARIPGIASKIERLARRPCDHGIAQPRMRLI